MPAPTKKRAVKRGRPPLPPGKGKRYPLNMRTTKETRDWLAAISKANGRSLSQEVEFLVEKARLGEDAAREQLKQEFAGPHNYALAKIIAFLAGEIEDLMNTRWTEDLGTFKVVETAIHTVLKRIQTPAPAVPREIVWSPERGQWFALGLLDKVERTNVVDGSDSAQVSRTLRLASEVANEIKPLLKRTPNIHSIRLVRRLVKEKPKNRGKN